jgi:hypothetical protein
MRRAVRGAACGLACLLAVALSGCGTLNVEQTVDLPLGTVKSIDVSAPGGEQKVSVTVTAEEPISAVLCTKENEKAVIDGFLETPATGPSKKYVLGGDIRKKDINFEATVPGKTAFVLVLSADKKTTAHVKLVGK